MSTPVLELEQYFDGALRADGLVIDRRGRLLKSFSADLQGRWRGGQGELVEDYRWSDGRTERRVWTLQRESDVDGAAVYSGSAGDVVGSPRGRVDGNRFSWRYQLLLPLFGRRIAIDMEDWMVLVDAELLLNQTRMRKFGLDLGCVQIAMRKR